MSEAITIVATIIAKSGEADTVEQALRNAVRDVQGEPGCEQYTLHKDLDKPGQFVMVERWGSEAQLQQHSAAPAFLRLVEEIKGRADLEVTKLKALAG
ncbi:hypothetical protein C7M52_00997 [Mixta theicola]|nr:putative quinol monooxygenase [Mixta theicola]QHM75050.1 hypothetical protein C7M52_00997 [Mixta theicola]